MVINNGTRLIYISFFLGTIYVSSYTEFGTLVYGEKYFHYLISLLFDENASKIFEN